MTPLRDKLIYQTMRLGGLTLMPGEPLFSVVEVLPFLQEGTELRVGRGCPPLCAGMSTIDSGIVPR